MTARRARTLLQCQSLEAREVPSITPLLQESFETVTTPQLPSGTSWSSNNSNRYITSRLDASDGSTSLASLGDRNTETRFWFSATQPADASVSLAIRADNSAPISVFTRGQELNNANPSYLAARLAPTGRQLDLVEFANGSATTIATVRISSPAFGQWHRVTLKPIGGNVSAQLQRLDTGAYLNSSGQWQSEVGTAIQSETSIPAVTGRVGIWRERGGTGMVFVDDLIVLPPPSLGFSTNFDTNRPQSDPDEWSRWSSDRNAGFQVTQGLSLSPNNGFANTGQSNTTTRAWLSEPQPVDVLASVNVFANSLIPLTLMARGSGLDTATPNYYGLTLVRGVEARLVQVVNGVETTLASIKSQNWVSSTWLRVTLIAKGDQLRAVISRADNGQFLTPNGTWQDTPLPAMAVTNNLLTAGSGVGLARPARFAGTVTVDDLEVRPAPSIAGPQVTITASQSGTNFKEDVTFTVTGDAAEPPRRVEYRLNGRVRSSAVTNPSSWTLDTTTLPNGSHELTVWAVDEAGNASTTLFHFTTENANAEPPADRPQLPRKLDHIRVAQLAYNGNPMGAFEQARLADSVDLVIANPRFHQTIEQVSPDTAQLLYSNVSNLYQDLLTDWLNFADAQGVSRELAFYHVPKATPFQGNSPSAQPVSWFWSVQRASSNGSLSDVTSAARSGSLTGISVGSAGEHLAIGYPDRFRELNIVVNRPASLGWQAQYEYVSAVNPDGTPKTWSTLKILTDGTNGFRSNGRITFDPPTNWKAARLTPNGEQLLYLRVRTTAGTVSQSPTVNSILGRDYVNSVGLGMGTIPSFDYKADADGDGYLNDQEYARRTPGNDARFVYESRLFYPFYGQMRFALNPSSPAVSRWAADYHTRLLEANPLVEGLFLDNSNGRLPIGDTPVIEPTAGYNEDYATLVRNLIQAVTPKMVFSNTAGGNADATPISAVSTGVLEEFLLRPTDANWSSFLDVADLVASRLNSDSPSPYTILDSFPGQFSLNDPRMQSATLAYYYLLADPDRTMLMLYGGYSPSGSWSQSWIPALTTDVGSPRGPMTLAASGQDPERPELEYRVYAREYSNSLVMYKPLSYTLGRGTGSTSNATATTHQLGGEYRVLNSNGNLGPIVTQITLRNGEGVVLMKA